MPRMRWTLDQKKHHVAAWRASGLTREQYCELYDIPFKSLRQWPQDVAKAEKRARAPEIIPVSVSGTPGQQYLRACHPPGGHGAESMVIRRFTDGREPRGTDNEPSGNGKT